MPCLLPQCGMVNHPQPGDTIRVSNVTSKYDCRAYRVFRYFIKRAIRKMRGRMPENADRADADKEVFLCEPHPNGGCKVFTCSMCKRLLPFVGKHECASKCDSFWPFLRPVCNGICGKLIKWAPTAACWEAGYCPKP